MRIRFVLLLPRVVCLLDPPSLSMQTPTRRNPSLPRPCNVPFLRFFNEPLPNSSPNKVCPPADQNSAANNAGSVDWLPAHTAGPGSPRMQKSRLSQAPRMRKIFSFPPGWLPQTRKLYERSGAGPCLEQANQSISHACKQPIITGLHALSLDGVPGTSQPPPIREPITPVVSSGIRSLEDGKCSRWTLVG
jgi:hypothetical protein